MRHLVISGLLGVTGCALPAIAFDDLDAALLDARCERFVRCGVFPDATSCTGFFRERVDRDLVTAVKAGVVRYDGELAKLCVDALAAMTCDTTVRPARVAPQSCDRMLVGTLAAGADCEFDGECGSNLCVPLDICMLGACCPGRCAELLPPAALKDPCASSRDCGIDAFCDANDLMCHPLGVQDAKCVSDAQCDYGLVCDTRVSPSKCVIPGQLGEPCPAERCADLDASCDASHTCVLAGTLGAPCSDSRDCSPFARCDTTTHQCTNVPTVGMPCEATCAGEAWCDRGGGGAGTCRAPLADNEPCTAGNQCASFFCQEGAVFDACATPPVCI